MAEAYPDGEIEYIVEEEGPDPPQEDNRERDAIGRLKKKHKPRKDPLLFFDDEEFKRRYRISKDTVRQLAAHYHEHSNTNGDGEGAGLTTTQRFCLALRYFATGANMGLVGDFQGVDKGTVSRAVADVADFFYNHSDGYIKFPETVIQQQTLAAGFYEKTEQPRCIGAIDGTHVPIRKPSMNEGAFFNRKGWCSLNVMIVCDSDMNIINLHPGWGGSVADAYCFNASELRRECDAGFIHDFFILGDSGYPLKSYLFTPVTTPTTPAEIAFNTWHRKTRVIVEQTIGMVKQRFRCLDGSAGYLYHDPASAAKMVVACCCLHNVANAAGDAAPEPEAGNREPREQPDIIPLRNQRDVATRNNYIAERF